MYINAVLTPGSLSRSQSSDTGPSASCGFCCPLCPTGDRNPGKIRFIRPQGINGHRRPVPSDPSSGTPRESQAKFRDVTVWGLCRRVMWVPGPLGQYSAIIVLSRNLGYKTEVSPCG